MTNKYFYIRNQRYVELQRYVKIFLYHIENVSIFSFRSLKHPLNHLSRYIYSSVSRLRRVKRKKKNEGQEENAGKCGQPKRISERNITTILLCHVRVKETFPIETLVGDTGGVTTKSKGTRLKMEVWSQVGGKKRGRYHVRTKRRNIMEKIYRKRGRKELQQGHTSVNRHRRNNKKGEERTIIRRWRG